MKTKYPKNKIQCTITKQWFGMTPVVHAKRLAACGGDEEKLRSTYVCQAARTGMKQGLSIDEIYKNVTQGKPITRSKSKKHKKSPNNKENIVNTIFNPCDKVKRNIDIEIREFLGIA